MKRLYATMVLAWGVVVSGADAAPTPTKPASLPSKLAPEVQQLQGTWNWDSDYAQSKALPRIDLERIVIKGDMITFHYNGELGRFSVSARFKLNSKASPKEMDFARTEGKSKDKADLARYEVKDGKLKICYRGPKNTRPKDFEDKWDGGYATMFIYLKRGIPAK